MADSLLNIALIFGGRSAEHEVSILSARSIYNAFNKEKYKIYPFAISKNGRWLNTDISNSVLNSELKSIPEKKDDNLISIELINFLEDKIDLVFPVLHGPYGEDGKIQGFLDILNIPYIGCSLSSSVLGMDKGLMKKLFAFHEIPQTDFMVLKNFEYQMTAESKLYNKVLSEVGSSFFVKPANLGSSIGISKVNKKSEFNDAVESAFKYDKKIIFEKAVEGREIETAVLGKEGEIKVSAAGEIVAEHDFYNYQAKYKDETTKLIIPAEIDKKIYAELRKTSKKVFNVVGGSGLARIDYFLEEDKNKILVNEINTMPGFTKFSMYPLLFAESGIAYPELLDKLVDIALSKVEK